MADKFKRGDLVKLKSGGPAMTVDHAPSDVSGFNGEEYGDYKCIWFKGATRDSARFAEHLLEAYTPPKK
jgi:uncharacterized protein YodC (DUF2158 family)